MAISAEEWQVLSFFEVMPTALDKDVPWPYNDFLFEIARGDLALSCALAPAYQDVRIVLKRGAVTLYEMSAVSVKDVQYRKEGSVEHLDVILSDTDVLSLKVKPDIAISHASRRET